jgi:hypothetical protein
VSGVSEASAAAAPTRATTSTTTTTTTTAQPVATAAARATAAEEPSAPAYREVIAVTREDKVVPVYNLEVRGSHTFFVGEEGVLVHNGTGYEPPPNLDELPGFPGTARNRGFTHPTWTSKRRICQWDTLHGGVEVFNAGDEKHLGGFDHITGDRLPGKPGKPVKGRKVRK